MTENQKQTEELALNLRFKLMHPRIIHQCHDGETLIINLDTGHYYCLEGIGPQIWELTVKGFPKSEIIQELNLEDFDSMVVNFINELFSEGLLKTENASPELLMSFSEKSQNTPVNPQPLSRMPKLSKFTDLEELLLADPIHEIDDIELG